MGFWGKYIFLMGPEVKKIGRQKLLQHTKMPQHFHRLFFVLKIELKTEFCFLNHHLMSLNRKTILNIFLVNLNVKNIYFEKIPCFWAPFSAAAITAVGDNF